MRARRWVAFASVAVFVSGACSSNGAIGGDEARPDGSASVTPAAGGTLHLEGGPSVRIPPGVVDKDAELRGARTDASGLEPIEDSGLEPGEAVWSIELDGSDLNGEAEIRFPIGGNGDGVPLLARNQGDGWELVGGTIDGDEITVAVDHFSFWQRVWQPLDPVRDAFTNAWEAVFSDGLFGASQPSCTDESGARADGLTITSDSGDAVKWCLGREDGRLVLKVANNRRYAVALDLPQGTELMHRPTRSGAIKYIGPAIDEALLRAEGRPGVVIGPGDEVVVGINPSAGGELPLRTHFSSLSYLTSVIDVGIDVYATVVSRLASLTGGPDSAHTREAMLALLVKHTGCLLGQFDENGAYGPHAGSLEVLAPALTRLVFDCLEPIVREVYGSGVLVNVVAGVVAVPVGLISGLVGGGQYLHDLLRSQDSYAISITRPATDEMSTFLALIDALNADDADRARTMADATVVEGNINNTRPFVPASEEPCRPGLNRGVGPVIERDCYAHDGFGGTIVFQFSRTDEGRWMAVSYEFLGGL